MNRIWVVLALLTGVPALADGQETDPPGPIIDTIIVITHDIYSPEEAANGWVYRLTNGLHVTTRPSVVSHELLFKVGEPYDELKVAESERNLRARGLFRTVEIDTVRVDDKFAVRVVTGDGWTTSIDFTLSFSAGDVIWGVGGQERNLLGTGARAGLSYRQEPDRNVFTISGGMDRIAGTRTGVGGFYQALSDGTFGGWNVGVPFRANPDRWGFDLVGDAGNQRILQFRDGDSSDTYRRRGLRQLGWGGIATRADVRGFLRLGIAAQFKNEAFMLWTVDQDAVPDTLTLAVGPWASFHDPRYKVVTHYNGFAREVDVDLSTQLLFGTWLAPDAFGYPRTGFGPVVEARAGGSLGPMFGWATVHANGLYTSSGLDSGTVVATGTLVGQFVRKTSSVLHIEVGAMKNNMPGFEFDLGIVFGPRAFPAHAFTGNRMAWGTLEQRMFLIDELFGFMGLGFAAFLDYGGAWYADEDPRLGGDVGLGLRFGGTRGTAANVGRLDLAYRFGEGCVPASEGSCVGNRWAISFGRAFPF